MLQDWGASSCSVIPDPLQEAQLGVDWEGGLSSKASPSNAVGEGGFPLVPSLLSAAGRSGQEHPCWHSGNPLCLPSACARSPVRAPACEIQFSITKRPHQFAHQKAGHSIVYVWSGTKRRHGRKRAEIFIAADGKSWTCGKMGNLDSPFFWLVNSAFVSSLQWLQWLYIAHIKQKYIHYFLKAKWIV